MKKKFPTPIQTLGQTVVIERKDLLLAIVEAPNKVIRNNLYTHLHTSLLTSFVAPTDTYDDSEASTRKVEEEEAEGAAETERKQQRVRFPLLQMSHESDGARELRGMHKHYEEKK